MADRWREMGRLIRDYDWAKTALGPAELWPQSLRSAVSILLPSKAQIILVWGHELITLYNDAYRSVFGSKHPRVLGLPVRESWSELWDVGLRELFEGVLTTGEAYWANDRPFFVERFGYLEETFFDVSYDPVRDETGQVGGIFCIVNETTARVIGERRLKTLRELSARMTEEANSVDEVCRVAARILAGNRHDLPFALIYLLDAGAKYSRLVGSAGLSEGFPAVGQQVDMTASGGEGAAWPFHEVLEARHAVVVTELGRRFDALPGGVWPESPHTAVILPITAPGQDRFAGFLVAGISPRRPLDDQYRGFFDLLANQISTAITTARAYEAERTRAEALAELNRAKTIFFSNVSHEFRTPLTLMLGPIEEELRERPHAPRLEMAHRNSLRLLKLVNQLLDFSRIEAGRVRAAYRPTDLAAYTVELANVFRSAVGKAGLRFNVACPPLQEPVYVDRDMWEKVVLNLVSNAFKFTFVGEIAVNLQAEGDHVELAVRDTGIGIAPEELPKIFDRFHRVEAAQGRTHEGTGIGLALVQELVKLHGGTVKVESVPRRGSTFRVCVPQGKAHLPADRVAAPSSHISTPTRAATSFVEEALRWLPDAGANDELGMRNEELSMTTEDISHSSFDISHSRPRVLVVDDNADMREYVRRLLAAQYDVTVAADGEAALAAAHQHIPDLVLADVMMPRLDGFGLLRELRADPTTKTIPIILLSARAGEESRIEGLQEGADDYLIKPFSARELLARVAAHLDMARVRKEAQSEIARSRLFLERIADTTPDMLFVYDLLKQRTVYINRRLENILGHTPEQALAMFDPTTHFVHPDDLTGVRQWQERLHTISDGEVRQIEHRARHRDGSYRWMLSRVMAFERTPDGEVKQIIGVAVDITERKQADEALRESEERLRVSQEVAHVGTFDWNIETGCNFWTPELEAMHGLRPGGFANTQPAWESLLHPADRAEAMSKVELTLQTGQQVEGEWRVIWPDGSVHWITGRFQAFKDRSGKPVRVTGVNIDVTERKKGEEALQESEARYRTTFANAAVGIAHVGLDGRWLGINDAVCRITGYGREELLMRPFADITHPDDLDPEWANARRLLAGEAATYSMEKRYIRKKGGLTWIHLTVSLQRDEAGSPQNFICIIEDITVRKQAEENLRESEERLRAFAGQLEHLVEERTQELVQSQTRLRNLATELNLAEQRERKKLSNDLHDYLAQLLVLCRINLGRVRRAGLPPKAEEMVEETEEVLTQTLNYSRTLMAELSPPVLQEHGLVAGLKWLGEQMQPRGLMVRVDSVGAADLALPGDCAVLLFQSVRELLMNALKHAKSNEVAVCLEQGDGRLRIEVRDDGVGFDLAAAKGTTSMSSKFGLFSIRERMTALGGWFDLHSVPGEGTTATLVLPLGGGAAERASSAELRVLSSELSGSESDNSKLRTQNSELHQQGAKIRVLLVDDHAMVRQGLRNVLESYADIKVVGEAWNGEEAITVAEALHPAVVLMDINMPKMNGIEATALIKARHPEIVVIGLSVNAGGANETAMRNAGAALLLTKEAAVDELYRAIQATMGAKAKSRKDI